MVARRLGIALLTLALAFSSSAAAQQTIGTLDFFGLRHVTDAEVRAKVKLKEGDVFDRGSIPALITELESIPGVRKASIAPITVSGGGLRLFIGIEEVGARRLALREKPAGDQRLPAEMAQLYRDTMKAWSAAVRTGSGREEHSQGHALSADPALRKLQDATVEALKVNPALVLQLREVVASSSDAADRAAAAWLLGYAPDKRVIVDDLAAAARDPDGVVRNNATRGLGVIAEFSATRPELGIRIDPHVFVAMLGSVTWTDRNKASFLLDTLTKSRPPELLRILRTDALDDLIDIARWKSEGHSFVGRRILGRIAGWSEDEILRTSHGNNVEELIVAAKSVQ